MRRPASSLLVLLVLLAVGSYASLAACPGAPAGVKPGRSTTPELAVEVVAKLAVAPGNITVLPDGRPLLSLHQLFEPDHTLALIEGAPLASQGRRGPLLASQGRRGPLLASQGRRGPLLASQGRRGPAGQAKLVPYRIPGVTLDAVLGLQVDKQGELWLLDNGLRNRMAPRVLRVADPSKPRRPRSYELHGALVPHSFINDLAVDRQHGKVFIADPAPGKTAALIVLDIKTGKARRVLQGHLSVVAEDIDLVVDGKTLTTKSASGKLVKPRIGVNPIALDARDEWLYFGPMHGRSLYRVRVEQLLDDALIPSELGRKVERFAAKPICDGISLDQRGNVYLGDLAQNGIGVISAKDRSYRLIASGPAYSWIDAFAFGADGKLYTVAAQLQRSPSLNGGLAAPKLPFLVLRVTPLAPGILGR